MGDSFSLKNALSWFDLFVAALDCYSWIFGQGFLQPAQIFGNRCLYAICCEDEMFKI